MKNDFRDIFGDDFGGFGAGVGDIRNTGTGAYEDGKTATPRKCETLTELGDWFQGFALACRDVRPK